METKFHQIMDCLICLILTKHHVTKSWIYDRVNKEALLKG